MTIMIDPEVVGAGADTADDGGTYTVEVHLPKPKRGELTERDKRKLEWFGRPT